MRISKEIAERAGLTLDQLSAFVAECQRDGVPGDTVLLGRATAGAKLRRLKASYEREQKTPATPVKPSRSSGRGSND